MRKLVLGLQAGRPDGGGRAAALLAPRWRQLAVGRRAAVRADAQVDEEEVPLAAPQLMHAAVAAAAHLVPQAKEACERLEEPAARHARLRLRLLVPQRECARAVAGGRVLA